MAGYWPASSITLFSDRSLIFSTLKQKCAFKSIPTPTMETFQNQAAITELTAEWENMLAHQLPALPPFDAFWDSLPEVLTWLHGEGVKMVQKAIPTGKTVMDESWLPPAMVNAWHMTAPLERIRFAAANRLCVYLRYNDKYRLIEPYSLRRTLAGNILLYALRHETKERRAYRVDRIQGVEITQTPFVPQYAIELTPSRPVIAPQ